MEMWIPIVVAIVSALFSYYSSAHKLGTPPFHPSCRGVLQRTGTVQPLTGTALRIADPVSGLVEVPKPAVPRTSPYVPQQW